MLNPIPTLFVMVLEVNEHETIVKSDGIEIMVQLLKIFSADTEIVHVIFQIFVNLMYQDEEKVKRKRNQNQNHEQSSHRMKSPINDNNCNSSCYRTARRIHLIGYAKDFIIHLVDHYQNKHDDIRILGKSIIKDLIKTESHVAMETLRCVRALRLSNFVFVAV